MTDKYSSQQEKLFALKTNRMSKKWLRCEKVWKLNAVRNNRTELPIFLRLITAKFIRYFSNVIHQQLKVETNCER